MLAGCAKPDYSFTPGRMDAIVAAYLERKAALAKAGQPPVTVTGGAPDPPPAFLTPHPLPLRQGDPLSPRQTDPFPTESLSGEARAHAREWWMQS